MKNFAIGREFSNFAGMKHLRAMIVLAALVLLLPATATTEVSLLTCGPFNNAYSLYGHTAIRVQDDATGDDWVFSYGVFDFDTPFFVLRFALGKTDYQIGVEPFSRFARRYSRMGCEVTAQHLNLTDEEADALFVALDENYLPQNRIYRYNFYRVNCTTKARDMIEASVEGKVTYDSTAYEPQTLREALHDYTAGHCWAQAGDDLCLGVAADRLMTFREHQFLPERLMQDFDNATITAADGSTKPLVKQKSTILQPRPTADAPAPSPTALAKALLAVAVAIAVAEWKRGKAFIAWDVALMTITGLAGVVLVILFCSEHPTTSTNLQILILNPLSLAFIPAVIKGRKAWWYISGTCIAAAFIGALAQHYADGMILLALSLLSRVAVHLLTRKNKP